MHTHTQTHRSPRTQTCRVCTFLLSRTKQPDTNQHTKQLAEQNLAVQDRQTRRQTGRQHAFVSQSSPSSIAAAAKLKQMILKAINELSVNNADGRSFRAWIKSVCV